MSVLFSPLTIKNKTFKNRLVVSPMCMYSAENGFANNWHLVHLGSRAVGGAGLVFQEATSVSPEGRITASDLGLWKDEQIDKLQEITTFIKAQGAVPGIQLAHAGRKASCMVPWKGGKQILPEGENGWQTVAPSAIPFRGEEHAPAALDSTGIEKVIHDFTMAADRALRAGYEVVEIHAAHGYLIHQFLSPLSNQRTDDYGGDFGNRIRLLEEVVKGIHTVWPAQNPLFVRISASDWAEGGWTIEDSVELAKILKERGVDVIDCSSGGLVPYAKIQLMPGYQVSFAQQVKQGAGIHTGAVGLITTAAQAEAIITSGQADMVLMARELLRDPYFPLHAAVEMGDDVHWPLQYERAKPKS